MAIRSVYAIDRENLVVTSSSDPGIVGGFVVNNDDMPNGSILQFGGGTIREVLINDVRGGGRSRFNDDRPDQHTVVDGGGIVAEGTGVEAESTLFVQQLNDQGQPIGPQIEIYVFSQGGVEDDIWGFGSSVPLVPGASYVKVGGRDDGTVKFRDFVTCFAAGTLIKTAQGDIPIEDIRLGQQVWTQGSGQQPVRWIGSTRTAGTGAMAPVVIEAGALGNYRDLIVSQQHRLWIESAAAELHFGQASVLIPAKHLCGLPGIELRPQAEIHYYHVMFDAHRILRSNGILTESFFLADQSVSSLDAGPRAELAALFPDLEHGFTAFGETAAPTLNGREAAMLRRYLAA